MRNGPRCSICGATHRRDETVCPNCGAATRQQKANPRAILIGCTALALVHGVGVLPVMLFVLNGLCNRNGWNQRTDEGELMWNKNLSASRTNSSRKTSDLTLRLPGRTGWERHTFTVPDRVATDYSPFEQPEIDPFRYGTMDAETFRKYKDQVFGVRYGRVRSAGLFTRTVLSIEYVTPPTERNR